VSDVNSTEFAKALATYVSIAPAAIPFSQNFIVAGSGVSIDVDTQTLENSQRGLV
jgi:hypothetical protein